MEEKLEQEVLIDIVSDTVKDLLPLFDFDQYDSPKQILCLLPNSEQVTSSLKMLIDLVLPGKCSPQSINDLEFDEFLEKNITSSWKLLRPEIEKAIPYRWLSKTSVIEGKTETTDAYNESITLLEKFYKQIPNIRKNIIEDIKAAYDGDPAALSYAEVQLAYPGVFAVASHRISHEFYKLDIPIVPRMMSEWTHSKTGVDLHPGATVGKGFFIDHATGVVIGETAVIGNRVKIYQGVTLGAKSFPLDENGNPIKHVKRHPTVEDDVIIYSNATILGGDTIIGKGSTVGGNVFLTNSVPEGSFIKYSSPELNIK